MAAKLPIAGVMKIEFIFEFSSGTQGANVEHVSYHTSGGGLPSAAQMNNLAGNIFTSFGGHVMPLVNGDVTFVRVICTPLDSNTTNIGTADGSTQGGVSGATVPASAAVLFNYQINARWRGGRPRAFWPAMGGQQLADPSTWHQSDLTNYETAINNFWTTMLGGSQMGLTLDQQGCVSYVYTGPNPNPPPATIPGVIRDPPVFFPFTATVPSPIIGAQRRRIRSTTP